MCCCAHTLKIPPLGELGVLRAFCRHSTTDAKESSVRAWRASGRDRPQPPGAAEGGYINT